MDDLAVALFPSENLREPSDGGIQFMLTKARVKAPEPALCTTTPYEERDRVALSDWHR